MQLNTNSKTIPDCEQRIVRVLPRLDAVHRVPDSGEACISITNPRQSPASLEDGWAEVLRLGFHDTDRRGGGFTEMTLEHAMDVLAFGRRHAAAPLTVPCQFGQSRSVAVGVFLAAWLGRPVQLTHDVLAPNPWVVRQLRRAALLCALRWCDGRLLMVALVSPLAPRFRYGMMPKAIADTYLP
jgi:predicted protein tyrosine phosphatase